MYHTKLLIPAIIFALLLSCSPASRKKNPARITPPGVSVQHVKENPMTANDSEKSRGKPWRLLKKVGPGNMALVTLNSSHLRSGKIIKVYPDTLLLLSHNQPLKIAADDIAMITVKRPSRTLEGTFIGFMASGLILTSILCDECKDEGYLLVFSLMGLPGGLFGGIIGSQTGGDIEIIP